MPTPYPATQSGGTREIPIDVPAARTVRMPADAADYARRLFSVLHDLDAAAVAVIIVESVPGTPEWDGVRDRLMRARN